MADEVIRVLTFGILQENIFEWFRKTQSENSFQYFADVLSKHR